MFIHNRHVRQLMIQDYIHQQQLSSFVLGMLLLLAGDLDLLSPRGAVHTLIKI